LTIDALAVFAGLADSACMAEYAGPCPTSSATRLNDQETARQTRRNETAVINDTTITATTMIASLEAARARLTCPSHE
jgi:hypothetical protein